MPRSYPTFSTKSRRTRKSVALRLMAPTTRANATMRLQIAVPMPSSRPARTRSPGGRSPLELWRETRPCVRRNTSAAGSGDDGVDIIAEAASKRRCIVSNCWGSGSWRGTSTAKSRNFRSATPLGTVTPRSDTRHGSCGISPSSKRGNSALSRFVQQSPPKPKKRCETGVQ